jgi:hypothetical protein
MLVKRINVTLLSWTVYGSLKCVGQR